MRTLINPIILTLSLSCLLLNPAGAMIFPADTAIENRIFKEEIQTVLFHREGWELSYPVIELNGPDRLLIRFDDLSDVASNFCYTIIHCDSRWFPTPMPRDDYILGMDHPQISNYEFSYNTYQGFVHYSLILPNEDLQPRLSGNYILYVYENFDYNQPVLTRRFVIAEKQVHIDAEVKRPVLSEYQETGQQINFSINYGNFPIDDPYSNIRVSLLKNNRWDNAIVNLRPLFAQPGILDYSYQEENIFPGGGEYRYFDIKSLRYQSMYVRNIKYRAPFFHVELFPDELRTYKVYFYEEDLNGKYYVDIQEGTKRHLEADYVHVHFTLPYEAPLIDGNIYVFGGLTNWAHNPGNEMEYDFENKAYRLTLFLKQGYYNYVYHYLRESAPMADVSFIEGSHFETENDYLIYVYYQSNTSRYERVIGYQIINSVNK